jgi:CubicO group peptidase (beta-lactamase class C family)
VTRTWLALLILPLAATLLSAVEEALTPTNPSSVGLSAARLQMIARAVRAEIDEGAIPGAVVAIARKGKLAYFESFGFLDNDKAVPMRKDAIFALASMTKPFTATGALMLVEEGRILLNEPVGRYLPLLSSMQVATESGTEPARKPPTLQDLMRHTAGLTYGTTTGNELSKRYAELEQGAPKPAEFIERLSKLPLQYQPGSRWDYGLGHEVMGVVIESVTKQRLGDFLAERLFRPMGMVDTGFFVPAPKADRVARPFQKDPTTGQAVSSEFPTQAPNMDDGGSGAYSTAMDYLRFAELLRGGGSFDGKRYLGRKTVEFMTSDQLTPDVDLSRLQQRANINGYGFGLSVAVRRASGLAGILGTAGDFHWGGGRGTYFWVDPKEELSVVFMAATPGEVRNRTRQVITSTVLQAIE